MKNKTVFPYDMMFHFDPHYFIPPPMIIIIFYNVTNCNTHAAKMNHSR